MSTLQKLKETCQSYLKVQDVSDDLTSKQVEPKTLPTAMGTLADTKPTPGPLIAPNPALNPTNNDATTPLVTPTNTPAVVEFRRTRARILLDALTSTKS